MKVFVPDYYFDFRCLMGDCRNTCCRGWEIDIDEDAMARYRALPGEFGETLRSHIDEENGCFRLTDDARCPFLNEKGLCEIILRLGEGALCQICDDHPRFRLFLSDRVEMGLGLCCEAAARLILTRREPMRIVEMDDDGEEEPLAEEERAVLAFRDECLKIARQRGTPLDEKIRRLSQMTGSAGRKSDAEEFIRFLTTLETMNEDWTRRLKALLKSPAKPRPMPREWETPFEQLLCYLIFRHVTAAVEDGETRTRLAMVLAVLEVISALFFSAKAPEMAELLEITRLYSAEIEYSDENMDWILDYFRALSEDGE